MLTIRRAERIDAEATFDIRVEAIWHQCRTAYTQEQLKQLGIRPGVTALAETSGAIAPASAEFNLLFGR
ncbi:hypothetical protein [Pseudomonas bohemica]|uniref:hypothetical protein n=1 Tax=Pseudomonas bohemica TaxID=2044872 RepID=UPI000DA6238B|nr:hypothetical protein [Pseudomonas bohemica]